MLHRAYCVVRYTIPLHCYFAMMQMDTAGPCVQTSTAKMCTQVAQDTWRRSRVKHVNADALHLRPKREVQIEEP